MQIETEIENAFERKYPEPVALVVTRGRDGRANVMAVAWVAIVSSGPWMFMIGVDSEARTCELIRQTRQFVLAYPSERMARETLFAGSHHGGGKRDKLAEAGLAVQPAKRVAAPLLADAVANFECKLRRSYQPGDCPLFVGEVVAAHVNARARLARLCVTGPRQALGGVRTKR